jgi:hypothetical protein
LIKPSRGWENHTPEATTERRERTAQSLKLRNGFVKEKMLAHECALSSLLPMTTYPTQPHQCHPSASTNDQTDDKTCHMKEDRLAPDRRQNKQFSFYLFFQMGHDMGHQEKKERKEDKWLSKLPENQVPLHVLQRVTMSTVVDCCQK